MNRLTNLSNFKVISIFIFIFLILMNPVSLASSQSYIINYTPDQVTFQKTIHLKDGAIQEFNVTIVSGVNDSLTSIIVNFNNSGPLWGFFLLNRTLYYQIKEQSNNDPLVTAVGLQAAATKYADHAIYYTVTHILASDGNDTLAFYDTLTHPANDAVFNVTFLKGLQGSTVTILPPLGLDVVYEPTAAFLVLVIIFITFLIIKKRFNIKFTHRNSNDFDKNH